MNFQVHDFSTMKCSLALAIILESRDRRKDDMTRSLIPCPLIRAPFSLSAKEAVIEDTRIEPDVDMEPKPQQIPDAEDMYSVNTDSDELGYDRNCRYNTYLELSSLSPSYLGLKVACARE